MGVLALLLRKARPVVAFFLFRHHQEHMSRCVRNLNLIRIHLSVKRHAQLVLVPVGSASEVEFASTVLVRDLDFGLLAVLEINCQIKLVFALCPKKLGLEHCHCKSRILEYDSRILLPEIGNG